MNKDNTGVTYKPISEFSAAVKAKCPRCRQGDLFENSMYGFKGQNMHKKCSHCHLIYEREPGYFYVAMFVSYALNVAELVTFGVATYLLTGNLDNPWLYLIVLFSGAIILAPFNYRYSRVILMYWLSPGLRFDPEMAQRPPRHDDEVYTRRDGH